MGNGISKKSNNQGSTLIMVLIIVSFIAILGTVCTATAMVNFKMKAVDRDSKKAFYTDEQAVDEIYSGLGKLSMEKLNDAYQKEMASLITASSILTNQNIKTDNQRANKNLRENFTSNMVNELLQAHTNIWQSNNPTQTFNTEPNNTALMTTLNAFLEVPTKAKVIKVGGVYTSEVDSSVDKQLKVYEIVLKDCVVEYRNENGYFSDVTFNGVVALPDVEIQFTEDQKDMLTSFEDYSLIGNSSIDIAASKKLAINGNMYAGGGGLNLAIGSTMDANNSTIVTRDDIKLTKATLNVSGSSNIWCKTLIAKAGSNSIINIGDISNTCNTYVQDDLQIDGDGSAVKVFGSYYGYSYEGDTLTDKGHINSSAIIVNGKSATVDLRNIATLVLGGRAYIDFQLGTTPYMTGESLALKGDQEAYLVPGSFITNKDTKKSMSNPYAIANETKALISVTADNFFGYQFLNTTTTPYTKVTVGDQVYVYLNFSSKANSASYFKAILNDAAFETLCQSIKSNAAVYQAYQDTRNYMRSILSMNMGQLAQTSFVNTSTAQIYTNGSLMNADFGTNTVNTKDYSLIDNTSVLKDAFAINALDLSSRYSLITKTLYSPSMYKITNGAIEKDESGNPIRDILHSYDVDNDIIINGKDINISGLDPDSIYNNIINSTYLNEHNLYNSPKDNGNIMYVSNAPITINEGNFPGVTGGVIISSEAVTVEKNFRGLIISGKSINVNNDVTIDSGINVGSTVDQFLKSDETMKKYFKAWNSVESSGADGISSISGVTYKDIVKFKNWSKTNNNNVK